MLAVLAIMPALLGNLPRAQAQELIEVNATGVGADADAAEKQALISAVTQAVGAYIDNEMLVKNERIVYDKILAASNGFIKDYKVTGAARKRLSDGLFEIRIRAVVQKGQVGAALRAAGVTSEVAVDGKNIWAEAMTRLKSQDDAEALLFDVIAKVAENIIDLSVANDKPITTRDPNTGHSRYLYFVDVKTRVQWWFAEAAPALKAALDIVAMEKGEQTVAFTPVRGDAPLPEPWARTRVYHGPWGQSSATDGEMAVPAYNALTSSWENFVIKNAPRGQGAYDGRYFLEEDVVPGILMSPSTYTTSGEVSMGFDLTFPVRKSKAGNQCTFAGYKLPKSLWTRITEAVFEDMHAFSNPKQEKKHRLLFQLLDSQGEVVNEQSVGSPFDLFFLDPINRPMQIGGAWLLFSRGVGLPRRAYVKRIGYLVELPPEEYKNVARLRVKWGPVSGGAAGQ